MKKLTPKQQAFVDAYTGPARGNATEAARMAGYKGNDTTLRAVGAENLTKPLVIAAVKKTADATQKRARLDRHGLQTWLEDVVLDEAGERLTMAPEGPVSEGPKWSDRIAAAKLLATMRGHLLKPDVIREQLQELKPRMSREAYRELLLALQGD